MNRNMLNEKERNIVEYNKKLFEEMHHAKRHWENDQDNISKFNDYQGAANKWKKHFDDEFINIGITK